MYTAIARIAKKLKGEMLYETDLPTKKSDNAAKYMALENE